MPAFKRSSKNRDCLYYLNSSAKSLRNFPWFGLAIVWDEFLKYCFYYTSTFLSVPLNNTVMIPKVMDSFIMALPSAERWGAVGSLAILEELCSRKLHWKVFQILHKNTCNGDLTKYAGPVFGITTMRWTEKERVSYGRNTIIQKLHSARCPSFNVHIYFVDIRLPENTQLSSSARAFSKRVFLITYTCDFFFPLFLFSRFS